MEPTERRSFSRPFAQRLWGDEPRDVTPLAARPPAETYPLTFAQEQIWFVERLVPGRSVYNVGQAFALDGELDPGALRGALAALVARHQSLRCSFAENEGRPVMRVDPGALLDLVDVDLSGRPEELQARMNAEAHAPFDLSRAPLSRATLYRLGAGRHALQLTSHHLIEDGGTRGLLARDLGQLYEALAFGAPGPEPLRLQLGDFALWQRSVIAGPALAKGRAFWRSALAEPRGYAEFPTDRPRTAVDEHRGARLWQRIDARTASAVGALGRAHGASPFMTFAAAYMALLHRYSGEPDTIVGFPTAGRPVPEAAPIAGCFVNTLALRADFSGDPSFEALLERVRDFAVEAYDNGDIPFNQLVEDLRGERTLSRAPLFSTMISRVERNRPTLAIRGLDIAPLPLDPGIAIADLALELREANEGLVARFEYNSDLFEAPTIARIGRHFERLLQAVAGDPQLAISRVPLLDEAERRSIIALGEGDFTRPAPEQPFHELFEAQVRRTPAKLALEYADERIDYRELNARANLLARALQAAGVQAGAVVGVCIDRSPELIVALLGILKCGAAFLPLDRALPADRLRFMLDETRTAVLVTRTAEAGALKDFNGRLLLLDAPAGGAPADAEDLGLRVSPDALAYVLYTSGSTGRPKGVMVPQGALVNHMLWMIEAGLIAPGDRALQKTPISFDVALWECFGPLLAGAAIVLAEPGAHRDPRRLVETIAERGITVTGFVPSMLRLIVEEPGLPHCSTLRRVFSAGEALPLEVARQFAARSDAELHNLYGPTETTIHSTAWRFEREASRISIGRPISRTRIYVVDPAGDLAPLGVAGELCIGGSGVALGYLERPELTAAAFTADPFSSADPAAAACERLYRTGDLARLLADGTIDCLGRRDRQVKLRGLRIELGEIEAVISAHPAVREAAVVTRDLGEAGPVLAAYVAMHPGGEPDARDLRAHAAKQLPEYMLPVLWTGLPELPKTASGKIDYRALPAPQASSAPASAPPQGPIEQTVAEILAALLQLPEIGRDVNFFDAGGHSLLAMRALARINDALGAGLPLAIFFQRATVAALAAEIERTRDRGSGASPPLRPQADDAVDLAYLDEIRGQLAELDDDEIDALLRRTLAEIDT